MSRWLTVVFGIQRIESRKKVVSRRVRKDSVCFSSPCQLKAGAAQGPMTCETCSALWPVILALMPVRLARRLPPSVSSISNQRMRSQPFHSLALPTSRILQRLIFA